MIVYNKKNKEVTIPDGLGVNITINQIADCPEPNEITITENGVYEGLYDKVNVEVEQSDGGSYEDGFTDGVTEGQERQKALLEPITITENGTYSREDGYNEVVVEVPQTGGSGDCNIGTAIINSNGTYSSSIRYMVFNSDDSFHTDMYGYDMWGFEIKFRPKADGNVWGYHLERDIIQGLKITEDGNSVNFRWGNYGGQYSVVKNGWNTVRFDRHYNRLYVNGVLCSLDFLGWFEENYYGLFTIGSEFYGEYFTGSFDLEYLTMSYEDGRTKYYIPQSDNNISNCNYIGYGTAVFVEEPIDGWSEVKVQVEPNLEYKSEYYDRNSVLQGGFTIYPNYGYDGMSAVDINIDEVLDETKKGGVAEAVESLGTLEVTDNGTYTPVIVPNMDIDGDDAFIFNYGGNLSNAYLEIKFRINRNGSKIDGALLTTYDEEGNYYGIVLDSDSQISWQWYDGKYGSAAIKPNGWNVIRFSPNNPDTSKRVWVNGEPVEVNEGGGQFEMNYEWCIGGRKSDGEITTGAFDLAYLYYYMSYQYGWEEGHIPFRYLPKGNNQISSAEYVGSGIAWYEEDGEFGWNKVVVNVTGGETGGTSYPTFINDFIQTSFNAASRGFEGYNAYLQTEFISDNNMGLMYTDDYTEGDPVYELVGRGATNISQSHNTTFMCGNMSINGTSLVEPWVHSENSLGDFKIIATNWYGGFSCGKLTYASDIFKNASELEYMESLTDLGKSYQGNYILDFRAVPNLTDESQRKIGESVYDFTTTNQYGIDYAYVIFNDNASESTKAVWTNKNWRERN